MTTIAAATPAQPDDLTPMWGEYFKLAAKVARMQERMDEIKTAMLTAHDHGVDTSPFGSYRPGPGRIDAKKLQAAYPVTQHPELYKPVVDTEQAKRHIAPADLDQFKTYGNPTFVMKAGK